MLQAAAGTPRGCLRWGICSAPPTPGAATAREPGGAARSHLHSFHQKIEKCKVKISCINLYNFQLFLQERTQNFCRGKNILIIEVSILVFLFEIFPTVVSFFPFLFEMLLPGSRENLFCCSITFPFLPSSPRAGSAHLLQDSITRVLSLEQPSPPRGALPPPRGCLKDITHPNFPAGGCQAPAPGEWTENILCPDASKSQRHLLPAPGRCHQPTGTHSSDTFILQLNVLQGHQAPSPQPQ